jgi:hypothetical protein
MRGKNEQGHNQKHGDNQFVGFHKDTSRLQMHAMRQSPVRPGLLECCLEIIPRHNSLPGHRFGVLRREAYSPCVEAR